MPDTDAYDFASMDKQDLGRYLYAGVTKMSMSNRNSDHHFAFVLFGGGRRGLTRLESHSIFNLTL